ncbi:MAG: hypothetical protein QOG09_73, partial [Solirubrobacterales bacterium]|nr:hypothetical protein [Solirubrobacterales bacterium]
MPLRRAVLAIVFAIVASGALSLGFRALASDPAPPPQVMGVAWDQRPDSVKELTDLTPSVVEADVTHISPGPDILDVQPSEPGGAVHIPTQRVVFSLVRVVDGTSVPAVFTLFKTGSPDSYLEGDPLYTVGERYALFIRPRKHDPGIYVPVAPDGRLRESGKGKLDGFIPGPVL